MYIKEVEIDNFKSFANTVTIPFLKGFTTISGPNGSGKSNIIDSILFALGLSTSRTLRAEKIYQLISTHTRRNEAYVKVTFASENPEEKEFTVARRIKKSTQGYNSIYYLSDKVVTLTEVHTKLEQYNITPNSYNVIMQNDVMSITNCSDVERRKIIDEIAGVADFDRRIEQAQNELGTVESRVQNSKLILSEVDGRLEQLATEREVALKYQKLREEKIALESQISTVKYFDVKKGLERTHEGILDAQKKKKEEENKLKKLETQSLTIKAKLDELSDLVKEKGEAEQIEVKKKVEELKGQADRKESAATFAEKNIQDNLKSVENAKNGIENLKIKNEKQAQQIKDKEEEIKNLETERDAEKEKLLNILQEVSGLNETADQYVAKRNELRKELEAAKDKETQVIQTKSPLEAELSTLKKEIEDAKTKIEASEKFKADFCGNKDQLEVQIEELTKELEDFKSIQQTTLYELDKTKNEINDAGYNITAAHRKIVSMEAQKQAIEDANFGKAVDTVLNAKIQGVHATLAQLGQVDKEYSTALEVAMGGRMKFVVVDDDEVAKVAIEILKSAGAGRATFLPLNKIQRAPKSLKLPKDKGVIDFAINLIDFDDEYLDAFYHALGDTLVVEDYNSARKLIGQYRMVTLTGELFEKSGSISGGSAGRSGLKFSQSQDDELAKYKERLAEFEKAYNSLDKKKSELEEKLDKVRIAYSESLNTLNGAKMELANLVRNSQETDKEIEEKKALIAQNEPRIAKIEKELEKLEQEHLELNEKAMKLGDEIAEIEAKMSPEELTILQEKTEATETKIKQLESKIAAAKNDIDGFNRVIAFQNEVIETHHKEIERLHKDNEVLAQDKIKYAGEIEEIKKQITVLDEKIKELGEKLVEIQAERDKVNAEYLELEKEKNALDLNIEKIAEQIEAFKARRRELEPQLENIKEELKEAGVDISTLKEVEISVEEITARISRLQKRMDDLGDVNMRAIAAYDEVLERQKELKTKIETLESEKTQIMSRMQGYEELKKDTFLNTYNNINDNFKEIFHKLSEGEGTLFLDNPNEPFSGGMSIEAQPRDKEKTRLNLMSGGEKSLTALAFVFAIQRYMPAPFYAFDEVDANLDGINVEKLAEIVKNQSLNTQFVVVSHRKPMIESANRTIGVTQKEKGITRVTGVKLRD